MNKVNASLVKSAGVPDCSMCGGDGMVERQHPRYGQPSCTDPTITILCPKCFPSREVTEVIS